jgi:cell division protein ZapA
MKFIEAQIMGQSYRLSCPENGEKQLQEAVGRVDVAMRRIRDAGKVKARDRIAVLAALNLAYDLNQQQQSAPPAPSAHEPVPQAQDLQRMAELMAKLDKVLGTPPAPSAAPA